VPIQNTSYKNGKFLNNLLMQPDVHDAVPVGRVCAVSILLMPSTETTLADANYCALRPILKCKTQIKLKKVTIAPAGVIFWEPSAYLVGIPQPHPAASTRKTEVVGCRQTR
jgi:hypothetical protein